MANYKLLPPMSFPEIPTPADLAFSVWERQEFPKLVSLLVKKLENNWKDKGELGCEVSFKSKDVDTGLLEELNRMFVQRGWQTYWGHSDEVLTIRVETSDRRDP